MWNRSKSSEGGLRIAVRVLTFVAFVTLVAGCGSALREGKTAFRRGRYPEAKRALVAAVDDLPNWSARRRAEHALYLGLTQAELGDLAQARRWLEIARRADDAQPGILDRDDRARLQLGLEAIEPPARIDPASPLFHAAE